jgi:Ser/Thr protein kinase RdoA (MazF antagonist)
VVAEDSAAELVDALREAFGWEGEVAVASGPRGATARIWRVTARGGRFALKEGRGEPPPAAAVEAEVAFIDGARAAGVRVPALHADRTGRWVVPGPAGNWLRLYDWVDVRPAELTSPETPVALGELLARLHQGASPVASEPDGSLPDPWYERPPTVEALVGAAVDGPWATRLGARAAGMPGLLELVTPTEPERLLRCHRDLHPANVLADDAGALVVIDHDDLGPADPARELARVLFDWWSDPEPVLDAMRATYRAYRGAGGPARIDRPGDFSMLIACRLNFLLRQLQVLPASSTTPDDRAWAEQEIDESLRILPTVSQIHEVIMSID